MSHLSLKRIDFQPDPPPVLAWASFFMSQAVESAAFLNQ